MTNDSPSPVRAIDPTRADGSTGAESSVPAGDPFPPSATNRVAPNGRDSGHSSTVHASAFDVKALQDKLATFGRGRSLSEKWMIPALRGAISEIIRLTAICLAADRKVAAAEARGRQQAEQERDQAESNHVNALQDIIELKACVQQAEQARDELLGAADHMNAEIESLFGQVAALTQALKDYGQHTPLCSVTGGYDYPCTCGLDAALTGAQA